MVLMVLFYSAIGRDSIFLLRFPFFSHVQVFSCEISPVCLLKYPYSCFLPISVSWLLSFCWTLCCMCCFWSLKLVFLCLFLCILRIVISMHQHWKVFFLLLFSTYVVSLCNLLDVGSYDSNPHFMVIFLYK